MNRLLIYGAAGTGCSTLGVELAARLNIPEFDSDDYFWIPSDPPFQTFRTFEEAVELFQKDTQNLPSWILSGSQNMGALIQGDLNAVVFLTVPVEVRLSRLHLRESGRFGDRIAEGGDMYEEHLAFLEWASRYDEPTTEVRNLKMHEEWFEQLPCSKIRIDGDLPIDDVRARVLTELS